MVEPFVHGVALLIAVDQNQVARWALPAVARDAAALHAVLVDPQRCAYRPENVRRVQGEQASLAGIRQGLAWLRERIKTDPEASAVVYFSGHGACLPGQASPYLVPYDADEDSLELSLLAAGQFAAAIDGLRPRRLLVVLDCCHAAGLGVKAGGPGAAGPSSTAIPAGLFGGGPAPAAPAAAKGVNALAAGAGRAVLSSSQGEQNSFLRRDGAMSIFTYHLVEALTGHAAAAPGQREVLVSDLIGHVHRRTPASARAEWGQLQQPDYYLQGNFPVALLLGGQGLAKDAAPPDPLAGRHSAGLQNAGVQKRAVTTGTIHMQGGNLNLTTGDIHQTNNTYLAPDPRQIAAEEREKARRRYLDRLRRHCQALPLAALGGDEGVDDEISLERVYIELDTTTLLEDPAARGAKNPPPGQAEREDREPKRLSALAAAGRERRLALLGDPGSGKSTFVRRLLAWLCAAQLEPGVEPPPGIPAGLTPVLIELRHLAARLAGVPLDGLAGDEQTRGLLRGVAQQLQADLGRLNAADFATDLLAAFGRGECLVVLDGLDEVPYELQARLRAGVAAIAARCRPQRLLLTCRIRSYTGEARLPGFQEHTLAPFDEPRIEQFTRAWYAAQHELGRVDALEAEKKSADLARAALDGDLRRLAENPMLLTSMAIIHQKEIGLPRERVRLYNLVVDVLLRRWQERKAGRAGLSEGLAEFLRADLRLRAAMERLAYAAHAAAAGQKGAADLRRGEALTLLEAPEYLGSAALAAEFLSYVDQRAGLLVGRGGEGGRPELYSFPHRTFQEYLAGCYLVNQRDATRQIALHAAAGDTWRLALVLGGEDLLYNRRQLNGLLDLTYRLCPSPGADEGTAQRLAAWAGELAAWAGELACLAGAAEIERDRAPDGGPGYLERLRGRLVSALGGRLSPPERAAAGRALARLGDPRPEALSCVHMQFCCVPAGRFYLGSDTKEDSAAYGDESPRHPLDLPAFWLGRYPVTQAQFAEFGAAGGYQQAAYWPEARAHGYWSEAGFKSGNYDAPRQAPEQSGEGFSLPNQPVVGVSWYEALAFTRWLQAAWQAIGRLPAGWQVRLPSEAEWEKAARGGLLIPSQPVLGSPQQGFAPRPAGRQDNPQPARRYPWGDDPDPDRANYDASNIGATSAVGCFPGGASPYGCLDLSGNVWEWTRSLWGKDLNLEYPYPYTDRLAEREDLAAPTNFARVVRGGAFFSASGRCRCAFRYGPTPDHIFGDAGFRVCLSRAPE